MWDRALMRSRNWGWLREKILGLLDRPGAWTTVGDRAVLMFTTRIQEELFGSQRDLALAEAAEQRK